MVEPPTDELEETTTAITRLYMSMSLDGFIAGPNESDGNGLRDGGDVLHAWVVPDTHSTVDHRVKDEFMASTAIVAGRGTFEPAGGWGGDHHGVPIWVLSRRERPSWTTDWPLVTYGNDVAETFAAARAAAGDGVVLVHGAAVAVRALEVGELDELEIHLVSTLLGEGRPLFAGLGLGPHDLERVRVLEGDGVTHLRYRVPR